jgi:hypothetical protein
MSRFREEMKVIPGAAWAIAGLLYLAGLLCSWLVFFPRDAKSDQWPLPALLIFGVVIPLFLVVYVLLVGYVNADARRRGMRHIMWTLLALFIPNAIGFILYFIMREPLLRPCPGCGTMVSQGFAFCSKCGGALAHSCPQCRAAVQPEWSHCTKCGTGLRAA